MGILYLGRPSLYWNMAQYAFWAPDCGDIVLAKLTADTKPGFHLLFVPVFPGLGSSVDSNVLNNC